MIRGDTLAKFVKRIDEYIILETHYDFVVVNTEGEYENHSHFYTKKTCEKFIRMIRRRTIPLSPYFRESALRVSLDEKYKDSIVQKIEKDRNKPKLVRVQKGRVRK